MRWRWNGTGVPPKAKARAQYAKRPNIIWCDVSQRRGVEQDYAAAVEWYRRAAKQGDAIAQNNLGLMYALGDDIVQDYVQVHMWGNIARSNGSAKCRQASGYTGEEIMTASQISEAQAAARDCVAKDYKGC